MRSIFAIMIAALCVLPSYGFTAVKEIVSEGHTIWAMAKPRLLQKAGHCLTQRGLLLNRQGLMWRVIQKWRTMQVTEDEIKVLTSGIMEVAILDKKKGLLLVTAFASG